MYRKFKRHFRAATQPHASAPSLAAIAAAPARSGSEPQPGGARQSAAWTCCVGWVTVEPQGFLGAKPSGRAAEESRGGTDSNGLANAQRCRPLTGHTAAARTSPPRPRAHASATGCTTISAVTWGSWLPIIPASKIPIPGASRARCFTQCLLRPGPCSARLARQRYEASGQEDKAPARPSPFASHAVLA